MSYLIKDTERGKREKRFEPDIIQTPVLHHYHRTSNLSLNFTLVVSVTLDDTSPLHFALGIALEVIQVPGTISREQPKLSFMPLGYSGGYPSGQTSVF